MPGAAPGDDPPGANPGVDLGDDDGDPDERIVALRQGITTFLGPDGVLARSIPHYEDRPAQRRMAAQVAEALAGEQVHIVEAGTGTGKTLAYLVPALLSGKRVVVATGTRTLQDQITRHDIPLLRDLMLVPFTAVVLKGVSNYLCLRKWHGMASPSDLASDPGLLATADMPADMPDGASPGSGQIDDAVGPGWDPGIAESSPELPPELADLAEWVEHTDTGDRAEVAHLADNAAIWNDLTTTPDTRLGPRCPFYDRCFVTRARRKADKADLIVVNHHLFFADLALRAAHPGARVLPEYDAVIFDEAHQLEDVITEHFGIRVSSVRLGYLARDVRRVFGGTGDLFGLGRPRPLTGAAARLLAQLEAQSANFFSLMRRHIASVARSRRNSGRIEMPADLFHDPMRQEAWFGLDNALDDLARHCERIGEGCAEAGDDEGAEELLGLERRARLIREDVAALAEQSAGALPSAQELPDHVRETGPSGAMPDDPSYDPSCDPEDPRHGQSTDLALPSFVYWAENRHNQVYLGGSPIHVASYVRAHVMECAPSVVMTSATLSSGGNFGYLRSRLGLDPDHVVATAIDSPFDYQRQVMLYLPRDLPEPNHPRFYPAICDRMAELLAITRGRAFLLFTSHRGLREAANQLGRVGRSGRDDRPVYRLLIQGQEPRATLIERFRDNPGSVLLGTGTFWQGVDVPGDALSMVIIDKLPFAPPGDPLTAARMRAIEARRRDPFAEYQVPQAALTLKQGFGRLIRRSDDRGIVAVLDRRVVTRRYGRAFLASLPDGLQRTSALEPLRRWWLATPGAS